MASMVAWVPLACWVAIVLSAVRQEDAHNFLDVFGVGSIEKWGGAQEVSKLHFGTIFGLLPGMWRILGSCRWWMAEVQEHVFDVAGHGEIDHAVDVVPSDGEAAVASGGPVFTDLIVLL